MTSHPSLLVALAVLTFGLLLLASHRYTAQFFANFYDRPLPTGFRYIYLYVLGPVFIVVCGVLAVFAELIK